MTNQKTKVNRKPRAATKKKAASVGNVALKAADIPMDVRAAVAPRGFWSRIFGL